MKSISSFLFPTAAILGLALNPLLTTSACDFCACPTPDFVEFKTGRPLHFYLNLSEQFTSFNTLRDNGSKVANPDDQYLNSSFTHVVLGAAMFENRLALQLNVPIIARQFRRPEGDEIQKGTVSGFGDLSLVAAWNFFRTGEGAQAAETGPGVLAAANAAPDKTDFGASMSLFAGLKFPTGSSSYLKEESEEDHEHGGHENDDHDHDHDAPANGIHGHDLALGSGSWDGIFGFESYLRYKRFFFQGELQYIARSEGSYSYRYANGLSWFGGPGVYLKRGGGTSVALQALVEGETKGLDTSNGEAAGDTGLTSLYLGPRLVATVGRWSFDLAGVLPVVMNNTELQATPTYRLRAGVTCRF